jgi:hypothetical protein
VDVFLLLSSDGACGPPQEGDPFCIRETFLAGTYCYNRVCI